MSRGHLLSPHLYLGVLEPAYRPEYSERYRRNVRWVIDVAEGGGKLHTDQGGPTKYGIAQKWHPHVDVANLTREGAVQIYYDQYWRRVRGDELPEVVALALFDAVVNQAQAIKLWQEIVGVPADGIVGPATLRASQAMPEERVVAYLVARHCYYEQLGRERPGVHGRSVRGWHQRLAKLAMALGWQVAREASA